MNQEKTFKMFSCNSYWDGGEHPCCIGNCTAPSIVWVRIMTPINELFENDCLFARVDLCAKHFQEWIAKDYPIPAPIPTEELEKEAPNAGE